MTTTIKYIIIGIIILGLLFLVGLFSFKHAVPGSIIAVLATGWAAFKSKIFSPSGLKIRIGELGSLQTEGGKEWNKVKDEYESRFRALQARLDYLDYTSAKLLKQYGDLTDKEKKELAKLSAMNPEEKLSRFNNIDY